MKLRASSIVMLGDIRTFFVSMYKLIMKYLVGVQQGMSSLHNTSQSQEAKSILLKTVVAMSCIRFMTLGHADSFDFLMSLVFNLMNN